MAGPTPPHPVLTKYYESDAGRPAFVTALFDGAAKHYDWVCGVMSLGSGQIYRRLALRRAGVRSGMKVLDLATGTGLVARSALRILREPRAVVGLDPSGGMLRQARMTLPIPLVQGRAEELPFTDAIFDAVSMGYALRHMADMGVVFTECLRVLKPGGRVLILEISRPRSAASQWVIRIYFQKVLPLIMRVTTGSTHAQLLTTYYWDTIAQCVPPEMILAILRGSGFADVERRVVGGLVSEYVGMKPPLR